MTKRKLLLSGSALALLVVGGGAYFLSGEDDNGRGFNFHSNPVTRLGGPLEKSLQVVPPVHDALWPPLPVLCWPSSPPVQSGSNAGS